MLFDLSHSNLDETRLFRHQESVSALLLFQLRQQIAELADDVDEEQTPEQLLLRQPQQITIIQQSAFYRAIELCGAIMLLIVASPIMLVIAAILYFSGNGSIIYSQERVGLGGKRFNIYKFRTMHMDAEALGPRITLTYTDNRITPIGKFLRKTKLDELPQLWNIVKDDMGFVGPRPERPFFHEKNALTIARWEERLCVKPGVTGLAQVTVEHDPREKIIYDLEYIRNRAPWLNVKIIILTALSLVKKDRSSISIPASFERI